MSDLHSYVFHWKDGKVETLDGTTAADALNRAGYGGGAVAALDYWNLVTTDNTKDDTMPTQQLTLPTGFTWEYTSVETAHRIKPDKVDVDYRAVEQTSQTVRVYFTVVDGSVPDQQTYPGERALKFGVTRVLCHFTEGKLSKVIMSGGRRLKSGALSTEQILKDEIWSYEIDNHPEKVPVAIMLAVERYIDAFGLPTVTIEG